MKKLLLILLFAPILFTGCKDETEEPQTEEPTFSLVGKKYAGVDPLINIAFGNCVCVYRFINDSVVEKAVRRYNYNGQIEATIEYKYNLNYPILIIDNSIYDFIDKQTFRIDLGVYGIAEFVLIN